MINRTFTINTYIDKFYNKLKGKLEKNNIKEIEIDEIFKEFRRFFDNSIVKDEYYVCNNISRKTGELFGNLIEHCNKLVIDEKENVADYLFDKIVNYELYQVINSKNSKSESFISDLFKQYAKNISICIKIDRFEWFKKYISKLNLLSQEYLENENDVLDEILYMNKYIGKEVMKKSDIWLEWFVNELYNMNITLKYAYKNINLNYFCRLVTDLLINCIEDKEESNKYNILKDVLERFTIEITHVNDNIQEIVVNYSIYGSKLIENNEIEKVKDFINIIANKNNRLIDTDKWNEYILYYLNMTLEKYNDELGESNRSKIIGIVLDLSLNENNCKYYGMLPEYDKIIYENRHNNKIINQICDEFKELLIRLIINNNIKMFYLVLKLLKNSVLKLEKNDKNIQEKLFEIFVFVLVRTLNVENKKFTELTIAIIDDCIEELDKNQKISESLGRYIIEEISNIGIYKSNIQQANVIDIIKLLSRFLEEGKEYIFISRKPENKKLLYKNVYNIGIHSIENNMENAVRSVSNTLGWFIIASIKNDASYLTNYLIERTVDLFKIAKNMEVTEKTLTFIMTLFTTVGTYCCKTPKYKIFLDRILEILKEEDLTRIKTAIELRTKENNMWDRLFEGKTQALTNEFLNKIRDISNKK